jgi:hypothetical protein
MASQANPFRGNWKSRNRAKDEFAKVQKVQWIRSEKATGREPLNDILRNKKLVHALRDDLANNLCKIPGSRLNKYGNEFGVSDYELRSTWRFKSNRDELFREERWLYINADKVSKAAANVTAQVTRAARDIIGRMRFTPSDSPSPSASGSGSGSAPSLFAGQNTEIAALRRELKFSNMRVNILSARLAESNDNNDELKYMFDLAIAEKEAIEDKLDLIRRAAQ